MVTGIDKLKLQLVDKIPKAVRAALEQAMMESADRIVAGARLRVPVETGEVRDSIRQHGVREGKRGGLYIAITAGDQSTLTDETGTRYQVARLLEFGTQKMQAQPYLLPSFRANRRSARTKMRKAIKEAVR
jgi:HK97 gp10 family phage protein